MAEKDMIWTQTAAKQRREILKYWTTHNHSDEYARKLIKITKDRVKIIAKYPESGVETERFLTQEWWPWGTLVSIIKM